MREILFRGQTLSERTGKKIWIEGYLILCGELAFIIRTEDMFDILKDTNNEYYDSWSIRGAREVIPETVGQFTGLCDKNGERIFEGDILVSPIGRKAIVSFGTYKPWSTKDSDDFESWKLLVMLNGHKNECGFGKHCAEYMQIIGNIHSNPELLE